MAFYTGTANDQTALKTALINACLAEGFSMTNAILRRGNLFVRPWQTAVAGWADQFFLEMGKSCDVPESVIVDSLGTSAGPGGATLLQPSAYPVTYDIHIIGDEVFMIYWDAQERYFWVAFGQSSPFSATPGAGNNLWIGGTLTSVYPLDMGTVNPADGLTGDTRPIAIGPTIGGAKNGYAAGWTRVSPALFWTTEMGTSASPPTSRYTDSAGAVLGGRTLPSTGAVFEIAGMRHLEPLVELMGSAWNHNNGLLPIQLTSPIPSTSNRKLVIEVANAHYFRLDHVAAREIITVKGQDYKVYPWYKRNVNARNASGNNLASVVADTGTLGWAIKYTGV